MLVSILIAYALLSLGRTTAHTQQDNGNGAIVPPTVPAPDRRGRHYIGFNDFGAFDRRPGEIPNTSVLTSPIMQTGIAANEMVVSWNVETPAGTGIKVEARAWFGEHATKFYTLGLWSKDGVGFPRESVNGQKDLDGDVHTDTLALNSPTTAVQIRVTLVGKQLPDEASTVPPVQTPSPKLLLPTLKYLGVSLADTHLNLTTLTALPPNQTAWGKEIAVPGKTQLGWPDGSGWCSPTSTSMSLAFWAGQLKRPELDLPVPDTAHAIYDRVYNGTGNWPFNTAHAGTFPGIRAYVTRMSDIRELEEWIALGIPVVVSVSYDLLKGKPKDEDPGHLMVCDGFTPNGDIVLNDPAHHPERGEACRRVFPRADFLRGWNRSKFLVYLIYPEGIRVPTDLYGHWDDTRPPTK